MSVLKSVYLDHTQELQGVYFPPSSTLGPQPEFPEFVAKPHPGSAFGFCGTNPEAPRPPGAILDTLWSCWVLPFKPLDLTLDPPCAHRTSSWFQP